MVAAPNGRWPYIGCCLIAHNNVRNTVFMKLTYSACHIRVASGFASGFIGTCLACMPNLEGNMTNMWHPHIPANPPPKGVSQARWLSPEMRYNLPPVRPDELRNARSPSCNTKYDTMNTDTMRRSIEGGDFKSCMRLIYTIPVHTTKSTLLWFPQGREPFY